MWLKKTKIVFPVLLITAFALIAGFHFRYPGISILLLREIRHAPASVTSVTKFFRYWLSYTKQLKFNPETGVVDFEWVVKNNDSQKPCNEFELGKLAWHRGDFTAAISYLESYHREHGESEPSLFWLALSYVRLAEAENCLAALTSDKPGHHTLHDHTNMCSLPLTVHHQKEANSRTAAKLFERLLNSYDSQNRLYQWLLNFCYMTVNGFPNEVPRRYLIQSSFIDHFYGAKKDEIEAKYAYLAFWNRAEELDIDTYDAGKGVAVEDFDRDGYLDIVTGGTYSSLKYYHNHEGRRFIDRTVEAGLADIKGIHVITAADYNNDGWVDIFVSRPFSDPRLSSFVFLRNNGNGTFTDVTYSSGLLRENESERARSFTWISAWADIDNDGDLDLFVVNFDATARFYSRDRIMPSKLYLNQDNRFVDRTEEFGLKPIVEGQFLIGAAFGDFDQDGFVDLAISSWIRGNNALLKNVQGKRFEKTALILLEEAGFMTTFVDVNHDGFLDLFYAAAPGTAELVTKQVVFGEGEDAYKMGHSTIWVQKDGRFERRNDFFRDGMPIGTMGCNYGDIDNDGAYDFYLGTGNPEGWYVLPNLMYIGETDDGKPTGYMTNISMLHGFGTIQKGHGIVFFDFDNDGDQDLYSSLGGMWPGDRWPNQFFVNESQLTNTWTKIRLRGTKSNYFGVGAKIKVVAENQQGHSIIRYYQMDNKTGFGSAPYRAHIGLLDAVRINYVEVTWPGEQSPKAYQARLGQLNVLDESEGALHQ